MPAGQRDTELCKKLEVQFPPFCRVFDVFDDLQSQFTVALGFHVGASRKCVGARRKASLDRFFKARRLVQMMRKDLGCARKLLVFSVENIRDLRVQRPPIVAQQGLIYRVAKSWHA